MLNIQSKGVIFKIKVLYLKIKVSLSVPFQMSLSIIFFILRKSEFPKQASARNALEWPEISSASWHSTIHDGVLSTARKKSSTLRTH